MKKFWPAVFLFSLALNLGLVAIVISGRALSPSEAATPAPARPGSASATGSGGSQLVSTVWPKLNGDDLPGLITRLRAGGFPPEVVRAIIGGLLNEQFAARRKELDPDLDRRPFWKSSVALDPKRQAAISQLDREERKAYRELLGADASNGQDDPISALFQRRQLGFLPPDRARELLQLQQRYQAMSEDIYTGGRLMPAERTRLAEIEKEKEAAIAQLLSPRELEEYQLRAGSTAENLRNQLGGFNATEAEFLQLYQLRRPFDQKFTYDGSVRTEEWQQQRREAEQALNEQIKAALGPARYQDYEKSADYNYRRTSQLTARLGLAPAVADEVWTAQKDIQKRAEVLTKNEALSDEQRRAQLAALASEATQRISTPLGPRGFTEYQRNVGGWLREIVPPEPPKK